MQIFVCHFRAESPMEDSMDTNEYLFTMGNHYRDPAGTTFHAKTATLLCGSLISLPVNPAARVHGNER